MVLDWLRNQPKPGTDASIAEIRSHNDAMEMRFDVVAPPMKKEEDLLIPGPNGPVPIRIYWPETPDSNKPYPLIQFMHGGGFMLCSIKTHQNLLRYLCARSGAIGVNVDYRLAPEHPFPVGIEDSYAVLEWLAANAGALGADADRIAVAGDSAGGNIAAVLAQTARDEGGPSIAAQMLLYPGVSIGAEAKPESWWQYGNGDYLLEQQGIADMMRAYLPEAVELTDPRVSTGLVSDLSNLPPTLIITAEFDPLRDEAEQYADSLRAAGVEVDCRRFNGTIHAFMSLAGGIDLGYEGLNHAAAFAGRVL